MCIYSIFEDKYYFIILMIKNFLLGLLFIYFLLDICNSVGWDVNCVVVKNVIVVIVN